MIVECDVAGCPERYRCLDVNVACRCPLYRMMHRGAEVVSYSDMPVKMDDLVVFMSVKEASQRTGISESRIESSILRGRKDESGHYFRPASDEDLRRIV